MERIKVFKVLKWSSRFFLIFGVILTLLGISMIIKSLISGFNVKFPSGNWNSVFFTIQGLLFIIMGYSNLRSNKYFIEWDDQILRFLLPGTRNIETINICDIESVKVKLFEIELKLSDRVKILNLENLDFEDLRKIKQKFEEISRVNK